MPLPPAVGGVGINMNDNDNHGNGQLSTARLPIIDCGGKSSRRFCTRINPIDKWTSSSSPNRGAYSVIEQYRQWRFWGLHFGG